MDKQLTSIVLSSHSAREYRDAISKNFSVGDVVVAPDFEYVPNPLFKEFTYVGRQPFKSLGIKSAKAQPHVTPGSVKQDLSNHSSASMFAAIDFTYYYYRVIVDRIDLANIGDALMQSIISAGRRSIEKTVIYETFSELSNELKGMNDFSYPKDYGRIWLVGTPDKLLALSANYGDAETIRQSMGAERWYGCEHTDSGTFGVYALDPSGVYWAGDKEPAVYVDEDTLRTTNEVQIIVEQAIAVNVNKNNVSLWYSN